MHLKTTYLYSVCNLESGLSAMAERWWVHARDASSNPGRGKIIRLILDWSSLWWLPGMYLTYHSFNSLNSIRKCPNGYVNPTKIIITYFSLRENPSGRINNVWEVWNRPLILNQSPGTYESVLRSFLGTRILFRPTSAIGIHPQYASSNPGKGRRKIFSRSWLPILNGLPIIFARKAGAE